MDRRFGAMRSKLVSLRVGLAKELKVYRLILKHERTPRVTRLLLGGAVAYALSPVDLIPDWIPVLGHVDDIVIVPALVWLSLRFVPDDVVAECRARVEELE
jgi:uncharacterized membrane protein YkvA (DUF1232 family)